MLTTRYHLDEAHLKYYDEKLKSWALSQPVKTIPSTLYPWTLSEKAGAVTFWPVGNSPLEGTVEFMFKETPPASGEKSPTNPSMIAGASEVKVRRYNKNMFGAYAHAREGQTVTVNGVSFTYNQDGSLLVNGQATATVQMYLTNSAVPNSMYYLRTGETYTLSGFSSSESDYPRMFFRCNGNSYYYVSGLHQTQTISVTQNGYASIWIEVPNGTTVNNVLIRPQLEVGSSATSFEPSMMDVYTVNLNGTYYGGTLDVASGVMTVTFRGIVFKGTESFSFIDNGDYYRYRFNISDYTAPSGATLYPVLDMEKCTHFTIRNTTDLSFAHAIAYGTRLEFFTSQQTVDDFKQWLAAQYSNGTPVVATYPLATPYTVQLTPPQIRALAQTDKYVPRLNTVYTDAQAVQVGYVKSPIREEFELQQAIVAQGGNV